MRRATASAVTLAILLGAAEARAHRKPRPPDRAELVGAWEGLSLETLSFFRLELNEDGSGALFMAWSEEWIDAYEVVGWELNRYDLTLELKPQSDRARPAHFKAQAYPERLFAEVGIRELRWKRELIMHPAGRISAGISWLEDATAAMGEEGATE